MKKRLIQRSCLVGSLLATYVSIVSSAQALTLSYFMDNDGLFLSDREYTSGLFLRLGDVIENYGYSIEIGSQIWTPDNINFTQPQFNERPFAGLLYLKGRMHYQTPYLAIKSGVMLGIVGPNSFAEDIQSFAHKVIGSEQPNGWKYQIYDKNIYQFELETHHLIFRTSEKKNDAGLFARIQFGNFQNEIAIGGTFRVGIDLKKNFGSTSLSLSNNVDPGLLERSKSGMFLYTMAEVRHRSSSILIEGDKPVFANNIALKKAQSAASLGLVAYKERWGASLSFIWQSEEFISPNARNHGFANVGVFYRF